MDSLIFFIKRWILRPIDAVLFLGAGPLCCSEAELRQKMDDQVAEFARNHPLLSELSAKMAMPATATASSTVDADAFWVDEEHQKAVDLPACGELGACQDGADMVFAGINPATLDPL